MTWLREEAGGAFSKASVAFGAPEEMPLIVVPTPTVGGDVVR